MNDKNLGMILVTAVMAPLMIVCCGGGIALVVAAAGGLTGLLTGNGLLTSALIANAAGLALLAVRSMHRAKRETHDEFRAGE